MRPAHPRHELRDVGRLDGGATPDAEARRRGAVRANVERDALGLEEPSHLLHLVGVEVAHSEADAGVGAHGRVRPREEVQPRDVVGRLLELGQVGIGAVHQALVAADALGPPESVQVVLGGQLRRARAREGGGGRWAEGEKERARAGGGGEGSASDDIFDVCSQAE